MGHREGVASSRVDVPDAAIPAGEVRDTEAGLRRVLPLFGFADQSEWCSGRLFEGPEGSKRAPDQSLPPDRAIGSTGTSRASNETMRVRGLVLSIFLPGLTMFKVAAEPAPAPSPAAATTSAASGTSRTIVGEIVTIDLVAKTVVIRDSVKTNAPKRKRESVTMSLDASTSLVRGKKPVLLEELRPKDHVVARYFVSPTGARALSFRVAERLVRPPAAPGASTVESVKPTATAESSDAD